MFRAYGLSGSRLGLASTATPRKLERKFMGIGAGILYTRGHEDVDVQTFWLLRQC